MTTRDATAVADVTWMRRALELASRGTGLVSPGALAGAVIVKDGQVAGEGHYTWDGVHHAEVLALRQAGGRARGATMYTTLEPCSHIGRTPPCAAAVIAAGISRVVSATEDLNPEVRGQGLRLLRDAGLAVECGVLEHGARRLNEAFFCFKTRRRPFGTLKLAMTLDGKIATAGGESQWITSDAARAAAQRLRHAADAIVTGSGTILADNPRLTDRSGLPRRRPLVPVVLDRRGRLDDSHRFMSAGHAIVFTDSTELRLQRAQVLRGPVSWSTVVDELARREIQSFVLECGPELAFSAIAGGVVDKVVAFIAPKLMGGREVPAIGGPGARALSDVVQLEGVSLEQIGDDCIWTGYVHGNH